ncbi:MAG: hypothetical protein ACUVX8_03250 [Candidatus Zipacnadales bacterium]
MRTLLGLTACEYAYERSYSTGDAYPNTAANRVEGPLFVQALIDAAEGG